MRNISLSTTLRKAFEKWITAPPFERSADRWPSDNYLAAWPGQYKDIDVELAWEAWQSSRTAGIEELGRWRDAEQETPDYGAPVLVMLNDGRQYVARRYYGGSFDYELRNGTQVGPGQGEVGLRVTHWLEIPPAPRTQYSKPASGSAPKGH